MNAALLTLWLCESCREAVAHGLGCEPDAYPLENYSGERCNICGYAAGVWLVPTNDVIESGATERGDAESAVYA